MWDTTTVNNGVHTISAVGFDEVERAYTFSSARVIVDNKKGGDIAGFEISLCIMGIALVLLLKRR